MSSIFDALKKLEDEKAREKNPGVRGELLRPPGGGGRRPGGLAWVLVLLLGIGGGAYYFLAKQDTPPEETAGAGDGETRVAAIPPSGALPDEPGESQETGEAVPDVPPDRQIYSIKGLDKAGLPPRVGIPPETGVPAVERGPARMMPIYPPEEVAEEIPAPAPPLPATKAPPGPPAGTNTPAPAAPVDAPPAEAPPPAAPSPAPAPRLAPVERRAMRTPPAKVPRPAAAAPVAATPEPPAIVRTEVPMMLLTEVTYHREPDRRFARIRVGDSDARMMREGDTYQGMEVKEIMSGAIAVEMAGREIVVDVGESLSFTVNEPDFH